MVEPAQADIVRVGEQRGRIATERLKLASMLGSCSSQDDLISLPTMCKGITLRGLRKLGIRIEEMCKAGYFAEAKDCGTFMCPPVTEYRDLTTAHVVNM